MDSARPSDPAPADVAQPTWLRAGRFPPEGERRLRRAEVWMWKAASSQGARDLLEGVLSPEERSQADRFVSPRDRDLYVTAHGLLRLLLAPLTGRKPEELRFGTGRWGKPHLADRGGSPAEVVPWFNIAHSGERVLVALAGHPVGVDLERHRRLRDALEIAERFFGERETSFLRALASGPREEAFFRLWTRKEAVVKAAGLSVAGLSRELDVLPTEADTDSGRCLLSRGELEAGELAWRDLPMERGYSAAYAAPSGSAPARLMELDPVAAT